MHQADQVVGASAAEDLPVAGVVADKASWVKTTAR
jgi:hypothetical protein